nr:helix-turn-helix domain-containing protein [uncultured Oscillibacter sp.]
MTIGERIRARRKELNLTMQAIYEQENIKTGNLSELERDKYLPSVQTLIALGRVLQCSIDWLLTGEQYVPEHFDTSGSLNLETLKTEQGLMCDGSPLDSEEADLVAIYRLLPSHEQEDVFDLVHYKYKKYVEKKAESIYWTYKADKLKRKATDADSDLSGSGQGGIA